MCNRLVHAQLLHTLEWRMKQTFRRNKLLRSDSNSQEGQLQPDRWLRLKSVSEESFAQAGSATNCRKVGHVSQRGTILG